MNNATTNAALMELARKYAGGDEKLAAALAAEVENMQLADMWGRMHGVTGELNGFGQSVVAAVAKVVHTEVRS